MTSFLISKLDCSRLSSLRLCGSVNQHLFWMQIIYKLTGKVPCYFFSQDCLQFQLFFFSWHFFRRDGVWVPGWQQKCDIMGARLLGMFRTPPPTQDCVCSGGPGWLTDVGQSAWGWEQWGVPSHVCVSLGVRNLALKWDIFIGPTNKVLFLMQ